MQQTSHVNCQRLYLHVNIEIIANKNKKCWITVEYLCLYLTKKYRERQPSTNIAIYCRTNIRPAKRNWLWKSHINKTSAQSVHCAPCVAHVLVLLLSPAQISNEHMHVIIPHFKASDGKRNGNWMMVWMRLVIYLLLTIRAGSIRLTWLNIDATANWSRNCLPLRRRIDV